MAGQVLLLHCEPNLCVTERAGGWIGSLLTLCHLLPPKQDTPRACSFGLDYSSRKMGAMLPILASNILLEPQAVWRDGWAHFTGPSFSPSSFDAYLVLPFLPPLLQTSTLLPLNSKSVSLFFFLFLSHSILSIRVFRQSRAYPTIRIFFTSQLQQPPPKTAPQKSKTEAHSPKAIKFRPESQDQP